MKGARFEDLCVIFPLATMMCSWRQRSTTRKRQKSSKQYWWAAGHPKLSNSPSIARDGHCTAHMGTLSNFKSQNFILRIREATHPALSTKTTMISLYSNKGDSEIPLLSKNLFVAVHVHLGQRRYFFFTQHGLTPALEALTAWCQFYPGGTWKNMKNEIPPLAHRHNEMTKIQGAKIKSREQMSLSSFHKCSKELKIFVLKNKVHVVACTTSLMNATMPSKQLERSVPGALSLNKPPTANCHRD